MREQVHLRDEQRAPGREREHFEIGNVRLSELDARQEVVDPAGHRLLCRRASFELFVEALVDGFIGRGGLHRACGDDLTVVRRTRRRARRSCLYTLPSACRAVRVAAVRRQRARVRHLADDTTFGCVLALQAERLDDGRLGRRCDRSDRAVWPSGRIVGRRAEERVPPPAGRRRGSTRDHYRPADSRPALSVRGRCIGRGSLPRRRTGLPNRVKLGVRVGVGVDHVQNPLVGAVDDVRGPVPACR